MCAFFERLALDHFRQDASPAQVRSLLEFRLGPGREALADQITQRAESRADKIGY